MEGENDHYVAYILENFESLDVNKDGFLSEEEVTGQLTPEQFGLLDTNDDAQLDVCELGGTVEIKVTAATVKISCYDYEAAHREVAEVFNGVSATCAGKMPRVTDIVAQDHKGSAVAYVLDDIAAGIFGFGQYDGSIEKTRELFHRYFLFQGGTFIITYTVDSTSVEQTLVVNKNCRGCLGCYSCDACAGCRPIPDNVMDLKHMFGNWLLVGLSLLVFALLTHRQER